MRSTRRGRVRSRLATSKPTNVMFSNGLGVCKSGNAGIKSICLKKATGSKNTKSTVAATPPSVTILSITAQSDNIDTSKAGVGKEITFIVTFSDDITITYGGGGTVELPFNIGAVDTFNASCQTASGNTSNIHLFTYTVVDGDAELLTAENVTLTAGDTLNLDEATVQDANGNNFTGGIPALTSATLEVDTLVPVVANGAGGCQTSGSTDIVFAFSAGSGTGPGRGITQGNINAADFSVTFDAGGTTGTVVQAAFLTGSSPGAGVPANTVLLELSNPGGTPIDSADVFSVTFTKTANSTFADEYGNQVQSFGPQSVTNNVP